MSDESYYERGSARDRYSRRKASDQMPLIIALGVAAVVCVVVFFIISGSSSGQEELEKATKTFEQIAVAALSDNDFDGVKLVDPRSVLEQWNKEELKKWNTDMTPARKKELTEQAWHTIKTTLLTDLNIDSMDAFRSRLSAATGEVDTLAETVVIRFPYLGDEWHAKISTRTGKIKRLAKR